MKKVSKKSTAAFMAAVLTPIPDADLTDKGLARLEERARREAKRRAEFEWHEGWLRVQEADLLRRAANYRRLIDNADVGCPKCADADRRYYREVARQMTVPAVMIRHLRWKEDHRKIGGRESDFAPLIEADKARLGV